MSVYDKLKISVAPKEICEFTLTVKGAYLRNALCAFCKERRIRYNVSGLNPTDGTTNITFLMENKAVDSFINAFIPDLIRKADIEDERRERILNILRSSFDSVQETFEGSLFCSIYNKKVNMTRPDLLPSKVIEVYIPILAGSMGSLSIPVTISCLLEEKTRLMALLSNSDITDDKQNEEKYDDALKRVLSAIMELQIIAKKENA